MSNHRQVSGPLAQRDANCAKWQMEVELRPSLAFSGAHSHDVHPHSLLIMTQTQIGGTEQVFDVDRFLKYFYTALFSALEQTHCARM